MSAAHVHGVPSPPCPGVSTVHVVDSALGRWAHTAWRPPPGSDLAHAVAELWLFEGRVTLLRERTFPDGHVDLIVHLGPRYRAVSEVGASADPFPLACIAGLQTGPLVVEAPAGAVRVLGVRLRPVGAYAVVGCPLPDLTARTLDLADVLADVAGAAAGELVERCADAPTADACLARAAAWVAARLARREGGLGTPHAAVAWAAAQLEQADGVASVTRLREASGLGRTRFAELFRAQVGLGPKRYARVLRFRRALTLLQAAAPAGRGMPARRLSTLALAAGYYDQAHLDADFREFAGMTPTAFAAARRYQDTPSVAEPA